MSLQQKEIKRLFRAVKNLSPLFEINDLCSIIWCFVATLHFDLQSTTPKGSLELPETSVQFFGKDHLLVVYEDDNRKESIIKVFPSIPKKQQRFHHSLSFKNIMNGRPVFDMNGEKGMAHFNSAGLVVPFEWPVRTTAQGFDLEAILCTDLPYSTNRFVRMDDQFLYMIDEHGHLLIYDQETKSRVQETWYPGPYKFTGFNICVESKQFLLQTLKTIIVSRYQWVSKNFTFQFQYCIEAKDVISLCVDSPSQRIVFVTRSKPDTLYFHDLKTGFLCDTCCIENAEFSCIAYSSQSSQLIVIDKKFRERREYWVGRSVF